jgi:protein-tyrosine phosphatase
LIKKYFGSKRGGLNFTRHQLLWYCGYYNKLSKINFNDAKRLIFVCEGNICRSPVAELIAQNHGSNTCSFGLSCSDNHPADPRAIAFAETLGLDLSKHRTRNISHYQPAIGDLLIGMEPRHIVILDMLLGKAINRTLLGIFHQPPFTYIHDPYSTTPAFFTRCEQQVVSATRNLLLKMLSANETQHRT